ncbi:hypothetical protein PPRFG01_0088100 [Plasmodium sp.]|nr:hypothetical protein PPRFG01_0088100 [Plasmodium sp.]
MKALHHNGGAPPGPVPPSVWCCAGSVVVAPGVGVPDAGIPGAQAPSGVPQDVLQPLRLINGGTLGDSGRYRDIYVYVMKMSLSTLKASGDENIEKINNKIKEILKRWHIWWPNT